MPRDAHPKLMIIGHLGPALAARSRWRVPLGWAVGASLAPDLLRYGLLAAKFPWWEANEYSHYLPWSALLALGLAALARLRSRQPVAGFVVAGLVVSHVALDMLSGHKQLWIGGPTGLGLEEYQQLEMLVEGGLAWWGWRLVRRGGSPAWLGSAGVLAVLIAAQAVYLRFTFDARPYATRCFEHPIRPCWIRRRDPPPVPPVTDAMRRLLTKRIG